MADRYVAYIDRTVCVKNALLLLEGTDPSVVLQVKSKPGFIVLDISESCTYALPWMAHAYAWIQPRSVLREIEGQVLEWNAYMNPAPAVSANTVRS